MQLQTHQHDKRIINDYFAYNGLLLYIVFFFFCNSIQLHIVVKFLLLLEEARNIKMYSSNFAISKRSKKHIVLDDAFFF